MARLVYNNQLGTLGALLANSGVTVDASTTAWTNPASALTPATPAFSPPASSYILVPVVMYGSATATVASMTDSLGSHLSWTRLARATKGSAFYVVEFWGAWCPSAQTGMTVTATVTNGLASNNSIGAIVLNGASQTQPGGIGANSGTASNPSVAVTTASAGSLVFGAFLDDQDGGYGTPIAGQSDVINGHTYQVIMTGTSGDPAWVQYQTAITAGPGPVTVGLVGATETWVGADVEILAAPTTITFSSAPSFATLTGSDYIPLFLEPPSGNSPSANFEIVHLTAYTAGQTTGSVTRAQEGTSQSAHASGVVWAHGPSALDAAVSPNIEGLQNGVINSGDLASSAISINTATGALTFTLAAAKPVWVQDSTGLLVPIYLPSTTFTLTPTAIVSADYAVVGVELDTSGNVALVTGTSTATQLNTAALIASNSPATSSGKLRLWDFAIWNNAGVYNFGDHTTVATQGTNYIDRRPWSRGAMARTTSTAGLTLTTANTAVEYTQLRTRLECTGVPLEISIQIILGTNAAYVLEARLDGAIQKPTGSLQAEPGALTTNSASYCGFLLPSAGSHLLSAQFTSPTAAATITTAWLTAREHVATPANNGTV